MSTLQEIAEGVVVATGFRGINVGAVITKQGIICIDVPPYPEDARTWRTMLQQGYGKMIKLVVITDAHRDRLLGLYWFHDALFVTHDATYEAMRALPNAFVDPHSDPAAAASDDRSGMARLRMRLTTFDDRMVAYVGDFGLPLAAMPGPTPGNIWIHLPEKRVVFVGDSVVLGQHPYMAQAQSKAWLESLTHLRRPRFAADVIVPGRGPLIRDKEATQEVSEFLRGMRRRVQRLYRAEKQRAEVISLVPGMMSQYSIPPGQQEEVHRRLRLGLESIYDEFRQEEENGILSEDEDDGEDSDDL